MKTTPIMLSALVALSGACASQPRTDGSNAGAWVQLFNGRNLDGWVPKFAGYELGVNLHETFRVENGLLQVRYDRWPAFGGEFGHLFYRPRAFSRYLIAAEYRFLGEQVRGAGPALGWALRNNGLMLHSQSPESMTRAQDFPISLEAQLLGGLGTGRRSTANLCTPGTHVMMNDTLVTNHCINSSSQTYDGDQWVRVEVLVLADSIIKHIVNGDTVLVYARPQMGGGMANNAQPGVLQEGRSLSSGYITIQAETAPIDFRKIELLDLQGCSNVDQCVASGRRRAR
jgi:hypothetical protein